MDMANTHLGRPKPDYTSDYWAGWDADCHGNIDRQGDEHPAGFMYTYRKSAGYEEGCKTKSHRSN